MKKRLEIDIELRELFFEVLRKWRMIICCMLMGGILLGSLAYVSDLQKANVVDVPVLQVEKTEEEIFAELNIDELEKVITAVQLKAQIDGQSQYISQSILMSLNAFAEDRVVLEYSIEGEDAVSALNYYLSWIENSGFSGEEKNVYVNELVTATGNSETSVLTVQVLHKDATECANLAQYVEDALKQYTLSLKADGISHEVKLVQKTQNVLVDDELHKYQDAYLKANIADQTSLAKMKAEMNGKQVAAYLLMERDVFDRGEVDETTKEEVGKVETPLSTEPVKVSVNFKQVLLGMIIGAVLAVVYVFLAYIMTGKLRTAKEVESLFDTKLLGKVNDKTAKAKKFAMVDELIWKLENYKRKKQTFEEEVELAVASLSIQCQKNKFDKVFVSGSNVHEISDKLLNALKNEMAKHGIEVYRGGNLTENAQALLDTAEAGAVVLIEKKNVSAYKNMLECLNTCERNDICVLGMIVIEE